MSEKRAFVIDVSLCTGCYACQFACKDEHVDNDWSPYARPQPNIGQFWIKIKEYTRGTLPKVKLHYIPVLCAHCENAACMEACEPGAIYRREDGLVLIDPDKCTGCRECIPSCPYDAIYFNDDLNIAQKCTGCAHLLDNGFSKPRCVGVCHTGALKFMNESELGEIREKSIDLNPCGAYPSVYYLNIPKRFIGGTLYDPVKMEVITNAICTLTGEGEELKTLSDGFGDFWFEGLKEGTFSLEIESEGRIKTIDSISTVKDVNLGDIPLT